MYDLESLERTSLLLSLAVLHDVAQDLRLGFEVERLQALLNRSSTHATVEPAAVAVTHLTEQHLVTFKVLDLERAEAIEDAVKALDVTIGLAADAGHLALA